MTRPDSGPTPGDWEFVPGAPGFMGNMEEPPEWPYPPTIVAHVGGDLVEIATMHEPHMPGVEPDPETGDVPWIGNPDVNGKIMAGAKTVLFDINSILADADTIGVNTHDVLAQLRGIMAAYPTWAD
jgi:hypothetical protein